MELRIFKKDKNDDETLIHWEKATRKTIETYKTDFKHKIVRLVVFITNHVDMQYLHKQFLNDDSTTDVISFPYVVGDYREGEIYVNYEKAKEFAKENNISFEEELFRYVIHGILHVDGMDDHDSEGYFKMKEREEEWLAKFRTFHVKH